MFAGNYCQSVNVLVVRLDKTHVRHKGFEPIPEGNFLEVEQNTIELPVFPKQQIHFVFQTLNVFRSYFSFWTNGKNVVLGVESLSNHKA